MSSVQTFQNNIVSGITSVAKQVYADNDGARPGAGIEIKADVNNSGVVYIGDSNVTSTNGYPLAVISSVGESVFIPTKRPEELYVVGETGAVNDQIRYYMV